MCIRDRNTAIGRPARAFYVIGVGNQALAGAVRADDADVEPVSYTHLRAHETVLDLVCRLLLEKKKKTIPPVSITALLYTTP